MVCPRWNPQCGSDFRKVIEIYWTECQNYRLLSMSYTYMLRCVDRLLLLWRSLAGSSGDFMTSVRMDRTTLNRFMKYARVVVPAVTHNIFHTTVCEHYKYSVICLRPTRLKPLTLLEKFDKNRSSMSAKAYMYRKSWSAFLVQ